MSNPPRNSRARVDWEHLDHKRSLAANVESLNILWSLDDSSVLLLILAWSARGT
jgi:hypothetical protein